MRTFKDDIILITLFLYSQQEEGFFHCSARLSIVFLVLFFSSSLILFDNVDISLEEVCLISVYFQQKSHELLSMLYCGEGINSTLREGKVFLPSSAIPYVNKCDWIGIFKWNRVCSGVWVLVWKMIEKTNNIYIFFNIFLFLFFSHIY